MKKILYEYLLIIISILVFFLCMAAIFSQTIIENGGFESGVLDPWEIDGDVSIVTPGFDPATGDSLQVVPEGNYSAVVGDSIPWQTGDPQNSSMKQVVTIPPGVGDELVLQFVYAVVANDPPNHPQEDKPRFRLKVTDITTSELLEDTDYTYTSQSSGDWYLGDSSTSLVNRPYYLAASDRWVFRPWTEVSISLEGLQGHEIEILFELRDCNYGAHAAYGYLDGVHIGSVRKYDLPELEGNPLPAFFIDPPFWAQWILYFEQWGMIWLCFLLPILLLLLLFFLWLKGRKKKPRPRYSSSRRTNPPPPDPPESRTDSGYKLG